MGISIVYKATAILVLSFSKQYKFLGCMCCVQIETDSVLQMYDSITE